MKMTVKINSKNWRYWDRKELAMLLENYRTQKNWGKSEMARNMDTYPQCYEHILAGRSPLRAKHIANLLSAGVKCNELLEGTNAA